MTSTDICNLALSYLSKGKITSMEDNTEEAAHQDSIETATIYSAQERRKKTVFPEDYAQARFQ